MILIVILVVIVIITLLFYVDFEGSQEGKPISTTFNPPINTEILYYALSDGQTSPDSIWFDEYNGHGSSGVQKDMDGNYVFFEYPKTSTKADETYASLVATTSKFKDFTLSLDVRTDKQLRQNSPPNSWEVAWVFFRHVDDFHHYYFILKTNGIELGKKDDNSQAEKQIFLYTKNTPKSEIGKWSHWDITIVENHITIFVNNEKIIDHYDENMPEILRTGAVGLYNEDAAVSFDNVTITPIK